MITTPAKIQNVSSGFSDFLLGRSLQANRVGNFRKALKSFLSLLSWRERVGSHALYTYLRKAAKYCLREETRFLLVCGIGRKRTKNTRCSFHCNCLILGEVARPERFELPAFWFVAISNALSRAVTSSGWSD